MLELNDSHIEAVMVANVTYTEHFAQATHQFVASVIDLCSTDDHEYSFGGVKFGPHDHPPGDKRAALQAVLLDALYALPSIVKLSPILTEFDRNVFTAMYICVVPKVSVFLSVRLPLIVTSWSSMCSPPRYTPRSKRNGTRRSRKVNGRTTRNRPTICSTSSSSRCRSS